MSRIPNPPQPEMLGRLRPSLRVVPAGSEFWRIYLRGRRDRQTWNGFRSFGPTASARFDHHLPPPGEKERKTFYASTDIPTCIAEVFQTRVVDTHGDEPWLAGFQTADELALLDLTGDWPATAGASQALSSGLHSCSQQWSRAIYEAYPHLHGLWYCSSMNGNRPAIALYERAEAAIAPAPFFHRALADPLLLTPLRNAARSLDYLLV